MVLHPYAPRGAVLLAAAVLLSCGGCVARYVRIKEKGMTCVEAQHVAVESVWRMNYTISEVTKPSPNSPGIIVAGRQDGSSKRSMMVSVFCTSQGAEIEAKTEGGAVAQLSFPSEFRRSFEIAAANQAPPRRAAASGVDVLLIPGRVDTDVGVDWTSLGVLPVSIRISNQTARVYRFENRRVELRTADRERAVPIGVGDLAAHLTPAQSEKLRQLVVDDRDIEAHATLAGLLLFPFSAYVRARVELVDQLSGESEGFAIEF